MKIIQDHIDLKLECDGLSRVFTYLLAQAGIPHAIWFGSITYLPSQIMFPTHFWIDLEDGSGLRIDYAARLWLGEKAAHGIFDPFEDFSDTLYAPTQQINESVSEIVFDVLVQTGRMDTMAMLAALRNETHGED